MKLSEDEPRTCTISTSVPQSLYEQFLHYCQRWETNPSQIMREFIYKQLESNHPPTSPVAMQEKLLEIEDRLKTFQDYAIDNEIVLQRTLIMTQTLFYIQGGEYLDKGLMPPEFHCDLRKIKKDIPDRQVYLNKLVKYQEAKKAGDFEKSEKLWKEIAEA